MNGRPDVLLAWPKRAALDLGYLRRLLAPGLRPRIVSGAVWATVAARERSGASERGGTDWIFREGDELPGWLFGRRSRPAAAAVGDLVLRLDAYPPNAAASAAKAAMPSAVSGWSATVESTAAGTVRMSAPARRHSVSWTGLRKLAARISVVIR